ncbi:MAG: hypothetical protein EOO04_36555 [Chitinophagaceae bacterium]|nr:MAG: hypothetical protein EOO04_36555 [Chitinophagaceae bacterium]
MPCLRLNKQVAGFVAAIVVFSACTNHYKDLIVVKPSGSDTKTRAWQAGSDLNKHDRQAASLSVDPSCVQKFKPAFTSTLYNTQVNVVGRHLSGLLLFKQMPDSSMRVVFSSEMGVKFFDFEFGKDGGFTVHQVMKQLDKPSVINTLRSDFELLMMRNLPIDSAVVRKDSVLTWVGFPAAFKNGRPKETHYYITDKQCGQLVRIENAMKRKPKVLILMDNYHNGVPDTIGITHKNFNFDIGLKYIQR